MGNGTAVTVVRIPIAGGRRGGPGTAKAAAAPVYAPPAYAVPQGADEASRLGQIMSAG